MSDEQAQSKRERQKQRREAKLVQQRKEAVKARRQRTLTFGLIAALLLGLIGWGGFRIWSDRAAEREARAAATAQLSELGCTEATAMPNLGAGHLGGTDLAVSPPDAIYPDRPTTSGRHIGSVALTGVYDKPIDERLLVHNLEHGYVNVFYKSDADEEQVAELKAYGEELIDGRYEKLIVSEWTDDMPEEANFAFVAWDARQLCRDFSRDVLLAFLADYHHLSGSAPEKTVQAHTRRGEQGVFDPNEEEGPLYFPPLGETTGGGEDNMDDLETPAGDVPDPSPTDGATDQPTEEATSAPGS